MAFRYALREGLSLLGAAVALFWSAGRVDWPAAWAVLAINACWMIAMGIIIFRYNPGLLPERMSQQPDARNWDKAVLGLLGLLQLIRYIVAGLDQRYAWSGEFPPAAQLAAFLACCLGYGLFTWAMGANAYFSRYVKIQVERNHTVVTGGPYRFIRHPGYAGMILYELACPILLASWWALIPSLLCVGMLILRTMLEDHTLQAELPGYTEYANRVRRRLIPGVI
jgi:protein-S-isoprenylcysteine O-methyltransferase Ste14